MAARKPGFFSELKRRNVLRAAVLYSGAVWALSQGISQLSGPLHLPDWVTVWFLIACAIGFPLWLAFAWFYEWTPQGLKRESQIAGDASLTRSTGRRMDRAIIAVMAIAIALLASGYFVHRKPTESAVATAAAAIPAQSIAVLPFENLSTDKANQYFVDGMQDLILTKLADIGSLKVIARTSTQSYGSHPENLTLVGQQLGVATILEGSVQKADNEVLINVRLIDARTDSHIWAQSYTRTLDNVFNVEGDVAGKIADALNAKLSPAETARLASDLSSNNAANDLFLQAEYQASQGITNLDDASFKAAIPLYQQAIAQAPAFALAHARLSYVQSNLAWFGGDGMDVQQLFADARSNAEQALKLAPGLPAAHLALGYSDYYGKGDYAAALKAFDAALALRPNDPDALAAQGYVERFQGHFDTALVSLQRAFALDPRKSERAFELGSTYMMMDRYPDAERWLRRALALDPHNLHARIMLPLAIEDETGDIPRALAAAQGDDRVIKGIRWGLLIDQRKYQEALVLQNSVPPMKPGDPSGDDALQRAELYRLMGDTVHARSLYAQALPKLRARIKSQQASYNQAEAWEGVASAELGLGHVTQGLAAIAKAQAASDEVQGLYKGSFKEENAALYAEAQRPDLAVPLLAQALASPGIGRWYSPVMLWLDTDWDPIRHSPQFQALLQKYAKYKPAVTYDNPPAASAAASALGTSAAAH